jgi:hypothetical protein
MKDKTKNAIEKKLTKVEELVSDIRVLMTEQETLPILLTEYDTWLVPRRVEFCENCMNIKAQVGYAEVDIEDYKKDTNCMPNVTWCRTCGETGSIGVLTES